MACDDGDDSGDETWRNFSHLIKWQEQEEQLASYSNPWTLIYFMFFYFHCWSTFVSRDPPHDYRCINNNPPSLVHFIARSIFNLYETVFMAKS